MKKKKKKRKQKNNKKEATTRTTKILSFEKTFLNGFTLQEVSCMITSKYSQSNKEY